VISAYLVVKKIRMKFGTHKNKSASRNPAIRDGKLIKVPDNVSSFVALQDIR